MSRRLWSIDGNSQRLDGGAMFGNAPRALWSRWLEPDPENRVDLACRALLVELEDGRRVLFEAGIGAFFPPDLRARYGVVEREHVLLRSLEAAGTSHEEIDVVVLSHLHFDHAGGLLSAWSEDAPPRLLFPRARFVVGRRAFERAAAPHARDRASFVAGLPGLLDASGRLEVVERDRSETLGDAVRFRTSDGHTPGMLLAEVETARGPVVFAADLVPGVPWVHVPITMGYDRFAERVVEEKNRLLAEMEARGGWLFFTHDRATALARVERDERGRFHAVAAVEALAGER